MGAIKFIKKIHTATLVGLILIEIMANGQAAAQSTEGFYRGKQIRIVVGSDAGGGYDTYARLVAAHMRKHVPGEPMFLVQNMPGAGALTAMNSVVNVAPSGTFCGFGSRLPADVRYRLLSSSVIQRCRETSGRQAASSFRGWCGRRLLKPSNPRNRSRLIRSTHRRVPESIVAHQGRAPLQS